jgi:hypothetical protein
VARQPVRVYDLNQFDASMKGALVA